MAININFNAYNTFATSQQRDDKILKRSRIPSKDNKKKCSFEFELRGLDFKVAHNSTNCGREGPIIYRHKLIMVKPGPLIHCFVNQRN